MLESVTKMWIIQSLFLFEKAPNPETEVRPKDKSGTLVTPKRNRRVVITGKDWFQIWARFWKRRRRPQAGFSVICILLEWNKTKHQALLHCELWQHPALHLPAAAWSCIVMDAVYGEGRWEVVVGAVVTRNRADCNGNICLCGGAAYCKCRWGLMALSHAGLRWQTLLCIQPRRQEIKSARCGLTKRPLLPSKTFINPCPPLPLIYASTSSV